MFFTSLCRTTQSKFEKPCEFFELRTVEPSHKVQWLIRVDMMLSSKHLKGHSAPCVGHVTFLNQARALLWKSLITTAAGTGPLRAERRGVKRGVGFLQFPDWLTPNGGRPGPSHCKILHCLHVVRLLIDLKDYGEIADNTFWAQSYRLIFSHEHLIFNNWLLTRGNLKRKGGVIFT